MTLSPIDLVAVGRGLLGGETEAQIAAKLGMDRVTVREHVLFLFARTDLVTRGELASAWPIQTDAGAELPEDMRERMELLTFERNAYRQRCRRLQQSVDYLLGRTDQETATSAQIADLEVQRDALLQLLACTRPRPPAFAKAAS